ncbi:hypothetical protein PT2222_40042 [Paraburkholderia tropica]
MAPEDEIHERLSWEMGEMGEMGGMSRGGGRYFSRFRFSPVFCHCREHGVCRRRVRQGVDCPDCCPAGKRRRTAGKTKSPAG